MKAREKLKFASLLLLRAGASLFDILGILGIGWLGSSIALSLSETSSNPSSLRLGSINLPTVSFESLPIVILAILGLFLGKAFLSIALTSKTAHFLAQVEARAARAIAQSSFGRTLDSVGKRSRDEVTFAIQIGSQSAFGTFPNAVGSIVAEGFLFILILSAFILVDFEAALLAIVYFGVIAFLIQFFLGRLMQKAATKAATSTVEANSLITDLSETIRESSILGRKDYFYNAIFQMRKQAADANATQVVLSGMPRHIVESALIAGIAAFILTQLSGGDLTTSSAIIGIFLSGGLRLTASLLPLQSAFLQIKVATPAAIRALDILEDVSSGETPKVTYQPKPQVRPSVPLGVSLRDVSFGYASHSPKVLRNISLDIEPGSQAALIGVSGSGKSTLADIILGLLDKDSGKILIGGMEPGQIASYFPGLVGYVPQRPGLVSGTILQNIALGVGDEGLDEDQLAYALASSNLEEFVATLPDGLLTDIGKRKDGLSGGQLQRIGLARALYTSPKLLILDEATSALDAESENEINIALDKMRGDVTVVMIAHRLNTVKNSDMVFLMEEGEIRSSGKFQDLVKANKKVRNLANLMSIESDAQRNKNE